MLKFLAVTTSAGIGLTSIAAALFWSAHKGFLKLGVFSSMTSEQTYSAFLWSLFTCAFLVILSMIITAAKKRPEKTITADNSGIAIDNSGNSNSVKISNKRKGN